MPSFFVVMYDGGTDPAVRHVETVPEDPAACAARRGELTAEVAAEPGFVLREVTARTQADAEADALHWLTVGRYVERYGWAYVYGDGDDAPQQEADRRPGAGQLSVF
ncbi:hypothetical protein AB0A05_27310 [Streptomyces sp. NPDC046374]|uniref:hypothetical protein n=1 Tax=Streptomyces sp. NPDC046374 TaxID=3154917 RepID=UPI0033F1CC86